MDDNLTNLQDGGNFSNANQHCHVLEMTFTRVGIPVILSLVSLFGLAGNALVIYVISRNRRMNVLFFNLALADLVFIIVCVPVQGVNFASANNVTLGPIICKISYYVTYFTLGVSIYSLVSICILRYIGIKYPLHARKLLRRRNAIMASVVIWGFTFLLNLPILFFYNETPESGSCSFSEETNPYYYIYITLTSGFDFVIPFILVTSLSVLIIVEIRKDLTEREELHFETEAQLHQSKKTTRRLIILVILVAVMFFVCNGPIHVTFVLVGLQVVNLTCEPVSGITVIILQVLAISNASLNPIIFNFASKEFRKEFAKALGMRVEKSKSENGTIQASVRIQNGT